MAKTPEQKREYWAQYYAKNREKILARGRQYRAENREEYNEKKREYYRQHYAEHREEYLERNRKWQAENPEKMREFRRRSYIKNREKEIERSRQNYVKNREYIKSYQAKRRQLELKAQYDAGNPKVIKVGDKYMKRVRLNGKDT